jgi:small-conductance mechanosensitive channel
VLALFITLLVSSSFICVTGQTAYTAGVTFQEFMDDYDQSTGNFTTYDVDDTVVIEDTIELINYREDDFQTDIWLESTGSSQTSQYLTFNSGLNGDYKKGEKVKITVLIEIDETTGNDRYVYDPDDIDHITVIEEEEEVQGIDLFGYNVSLPDMLDNNWGRFFIYLIFWVIIGFIVLMFLDPVVRRWTKGTETKIDDLVLDIIRKPILTLIILYGLVQSLSALELSDDILFWVQNIYNAGLFLAIIWLVYKIINIILVQIGRSYAAKNKVKVEKILVPAIRKLLTVLIGVFAIITVLGYIGIDLTVLTIGGMVISMVIAFAAQDTLSNFFAGMFLIVEPYFKEGDWVIVENKTYEVRDVGMRNTKLYDLKEHMMVIIPNSMLANDKIINLTEPDLKLKIFIEVGVAYGTDPRKIEKILMEIAHNQHHVMKEPEDFAPIIRFSEFADSSLNFKMILWVDELGTRFAVKSDINYEIDQRFKQEGIEIPFPQRVVHLVKE